MMVGNNTKVHHRSPKTWYEVADKSKSQRDHIRCTLSFSLRNIVNKSVVTICSHMSPILSFTCIGGEIRTDPETNKARNFTIILIS